MDRGHRCQAPGSPLPSICRQGGFESGATRPWLSSRLCRQSKRIRPLVSTSPCAREPRWPPPGRPARCGITHFALMTVLGAAFVLIGLAGLADRIIFVRRVRARLDERDSALHAMGEETLRMKAACYDQERPPLADIRTRLEALEQSLRALLIYAEGGESGTAMPDHERTQVPLGGHTA